MKLILILVLLNVIFTVAHAQDGFVDYGVGAKVAECRGIVTTHTPDGRCLVIANALDLTPVSYVLVTDVDTGETKQVSCPKHVPQSAPFGSLMATNGKFYTTQGRVLLELDPTTLEWTYDGIPCQAASCYLSFTEGLDGTVWAGGYTTHLVSFDPKTREAKDHGRMDPQEMYLSYLATDDRGWVYGGIGTARCNIVAYHPKTGEMRQLMKEDERVHGTASVYGTADGAAFGTAAGKTYRLYDGAATRIGKSKLPARRNVYNIGWGARRGSFPDGRRVTGYDMPGKWLRLFDPKTHKTRMINFDHDGEGVTITSLAEGPNGVVYGSTCHPMHFLKLDTQANTFADLGPIPEVGGGNFCAIACQGNIVVGAQYSHGKLWGYDVTKPWNPRRPKRTVLGVAAEQLVKDGRVDHGHFTYLDSCDVAFLCGDRFGAIGHFKLNAPTDGQYYLHILPYRSARYCTVQFRFDGKDLGEPYAAADPDTKEGALLVHGPIELKAGEHWLSMRALETEGQEPWCSVVSLDLSQRKRQAIVETEQRNPYVLAQWKRDICRPRTALAHPDGKHVMMAGFAGYGLCGGGIGIYNLRTDEATLLTADKDLLPGQSCITLKALPNGDLVGGTSISAPGGGHTTAKEAELFILDWETKKVTFRTAPVPGDSNIISIQALADGLVYGLSSRSQLFVFDPKNGKVVHSETLKSYGGVPRHALQIGSDGNLYAMLSGAILRITPGTLKHEKLATPPRPISAGGALVNGKLCYASGSHMWTYDVPGL